MENKIKNNIDNLELLEELYQSDKKSFEKVFFNIYPGSAGYLPVYAAWTVFVVFVLPFIFGLK